MTGDNTVNYNTDSGLDISSSGAVTLNNITAYGNGTGGYGVGARIDNSSAGAPQGVTLKGTNTFDGNHNYQLQVETLGAITANSLTASHSPIGTGAWLDNCQFVVSACTGTGDVTLTGANTFLENTGSGLSVSSVGAITLSNITANGNGTGGSGFGVQLDNSSASTLQAIKLTGVNTFNDNANDGAYLTASGAITASNLTASGNGGNGI